MQCPSDIVDAIGGWSATTVGERYGQGYNIDVLFEWMEKIALPRHNPSYSVAVEHKQLHTTN